MHLSNVGRSCQLLDCKVQQCHGVSVDACLWSLLHPSWNEAVNLQVPCCYQLAPAGRQNHVSAGAHLWLLPISRSNPRHIICEPQKTWNWCLGPLANAFCLLPKTTALPPAAAVKAAAKKGQKGKGDKGGGKGGDRTAVPDPQNWESFLCMVARLRMVRVGKASTVGGRVVHGSGGECCGSAQVDVGSTPGRRVPGASASTVRVDAFWNSWKNVLCRCAKCASPSVCVWTVSNFLHAKRAVTQSLCTAFDARVWGPSLWWVGCDLKVLRRLWPWIKMIKRKLQIFLIDYCQWFSLWGVWILDLETEWERKSEIVFVVEIFNIVSDSLRRDSKACGDSRRDKGRIDQLNTWISDFVGIVFWKFLTLGTRMGSLNHYH